MTLRIDGPIIIGLAADFSAENPVLVADEMAFETDTGVWKRGNGSTAYNSLARIGNASPLADSTYPAGFGPVVADTSNGHTYRIKTTAGTLGVVQIT